MKKIIDRGPKPEALLAFYQLTWAEIDALRRFEWNIGYYFISIAGAMIYIAADESVQNLIPDWLAAALCVFQGLSAAACGYYLIVHHHYLTQQRKIRQQLERRLELHRLMTHEGKAVIPSRWRSQPVTFVFQFTDIVLPIFLVTLGSQAMSVYMLGERFWSDRAKPAASAPYRGEVFHDTSGHQAVYRKPLGPIP